ncbi:site-specific integrase [Fibrella forsythiae]|uniref:Site-specific integrase n=1 Tax=Fibrella forsythiae TaxID=2817061 RepID=A0ABS3JLK3_9BACT|nr:site-specific integrase [Fibrella forsythiae]MBO0950890.1 site-specific integrase [Fibrella forsythiae]
MRFRIAKYHPTFPKAFRMVFTHNFNVRVIIKDDFVKKDGTSPLYLYVSIDGEWIRIPMKLAWPPAFFDKAAGKLKPRQPKDKDQVDYTLIINAEAAKVNEIFKTYRLQERALTIQQLEKDFYEFNNRLCFLRYWAKESAERVKRKKIERATYNCHQASLNKFNAFWIREVEKKLKKKPAPAATSEDRFPYPLPFTQLTGKLLENFTAYCKTVHENDPVTIAKNLRDIKTYINRAVVDKYVFENPFKNFKFKFTESLPHAHTEAELVALLDLYNQGQAPEHWRKVLQYYLYSCFTGLRISDIVLMNHSNLSEPGWLVLTPFKTRRFGKVVRIPLHSICQSFITSAEGQLFDTFSEPYTNRILKKIGSHLNIPFKMTTHTARHTFGTLFIELGGDVVTLKDYMGHSKLETTMKYIHISEKRKKEKINVFDKLFKDN